MDLNSHANRIGARRYRYITVTGEVWLRVGMPLNSSRVQRNAQPPIWTTILRQILRSRLYFKIRALVVHGHGAPGRRGAQFLTGRGRPVPPRYGGPYSFLSRLRARTMSRISCCCWRKEYRDEMSWGRHPIRVRVRVRLGGTIRARSPGFNVSMKGPEAGLYMYTYILYE